MFENVWFRNDEENVSVLYLSVTHEFTVLDLGLLYDSILCHCRKIKKGKKRKKDHRNILHTFLDQLINMLLLKITVICRSSVPCAIFKF